MPKRLVYICDWLPPDFAAVGQERVLEAREWARQGWTVALVGLTSGQALREKAEPLGDGAVDVIRVHRPAYQKQKFTSRLIWTIVSNLKLLAASFGSMRRADAVLFT